ncbi:hypothetical protein FIBSPDRAFT_823569 [Athelia psychrophila]|uniref:Transmembrane protein n=1 Tax=Athelia psychrophila TaxID=1759441 RepID=A0A166LS09_9AGAM|nr:hypothetical protein FIBSPDRAFT_823569 [Fibularhizoctonia sp. CBS 109695]
MNSSGTSAMPNPYTPMAFLPPSLAQDFEVTTYLYFTSLGALIWDWLMTMPDEYRIASKVGIPNTSKISYFCARVFSLAYCLAETMIQVAPVKNCQVLQLFVAIFIILALSASNALFFLRVRAVYGKSRSITAFFGLSWFIVFVTILSALFAIKVQHIGPTNRCVTVKVHPWLAVPMISHVVNSTLVFLAISYRITSQSMGRAGWRSTARGFLSGDRAPRVAKALLRHGQLSYLVTIVMNVAMIVMSFSPHYQAALTIPAIALESVMTCRVHRAVILGLITDNSERRATPFALTTFVSGTNASSDDTMLQNPNTKYKLDDQRGEV